jgi:sugar lactone lactonase YvrE
VTRRLQAELLDDVGAVLGEGPSWDPRSEELVWVDILAGVVHIHDAEGYRRGRFDLGGHVSSVLPCAGEGWLITVPDGFALLGGDGEVRSLLAVEADRPENRFNDAKCDPWGQALAGTMRYDEGPGSGSLYRLETDSVPVTGSAPGFVARVLLGQVGLANGLGWSVDGATLYFVDSLDRTVMSGAYAPDRYPLGPLRELVRVAEGMPDGMCVDMEGYLWVAIYRGGSVQRFSPQGELDTIVSLPVPDVTSVAFGGLRGDRLFITTAGGTGQPDAGGRGGLWAIDPDVQGLPTNLWRPPLLDT